MKKLFLLSLATIFVSLSVSANTFFSDDVHKDKEEIQKEEARIRKDKKELKYDEEKLQKEERELKIDENKKKMKR